MNKTNVEADVDSSEYISTVKMVRIKIKACLSEESNLKQPRQPKKKKND
jgi:hypothetical protein